MESTSCKSAHKGRPPASRGENTRQSILDSALTLFAEQGVSETSIAQIAHASGVTSAMVHYYFHNREGLLDALVIERLVPRVRYVWSGVTEDALDSPRQLVTGIVTRVLEVVDAMPQFPQLWNREIFHVNGCLREHFLQHLPVGKLARLRDRLLEAQQKGLIYPDISPDLVIVSAIGLIMVPLAAQIYFPVADGLPVLERERIGRHALALLLHGIFTDKENEQ